MNIAKINCITTPRNNPQTFKTSKRYALMSKNQEIKFLANDIRNLFMVFSSVGMTMVSAISALFSSQNSPDGINSKAAGVTTTREGGCEYIRDKNGTLRMKIYPTGIEQFYDKNGEPEVTIIPRGNGIFTRLDVKNNTCKNYDLRGNEIK